MKIQQNTVVWIAVTFLLVVLVLAGTFLVYQHQRLERLQEQQAYFTELCELAEGGTLGYANESFRATKAFMVLNCGETEELKLTANWEGGGRVFVDCSSDAAELAFKEETWEKYTTMSVKGIHPGFMVAHFTSDAADKGFYVCVLVKE